MASSSSRAPSLLPPLRSWWWLLAAAALFAVGVAGGLLAKAGGARAPELQVDIGLSHERNPVLTLLAQAINYAFSPVGGAALLALVFLFLLFVRRAPMHALAFASVVCVGWFSSEIGKRLVERLRPPADAVAALVPEHGMDSFPSGHTSYAMALAWAVIFLVGRSRRSRTILACAAAVFVALVASSRIYLGVHYPTDVLGAMVISSAAILAWLPIWTNLVAPQLGRFTRPVPAAAPTIDQEPSPPEMPRRG